MQQHTIDETNINIILKTLWAIRDNDKFYFMSYGKEMIENYIDQRLSEIKN